MRVIAALARGGARGRVGSLVGLAAVVALGIGTALGALAIAARTDRAYADHLERADVAEVVVNPSIGTEWAEETIASTEGVRSYASDDVLSATFDDGAPRTQSAVDSVMSQLRVSFDGRYARQDRPVVQEGRFLREGEKEAFLGRSVADALGVGLGDTLPLAFWVTSYNTAGIGAAQGDLVEPIGHSAATVVGIGLFADEVLPDELFPQERVLVTPEVAGPFTCTHNDPTALPADADIQTAFAAVAPANCAFSYRYFSIQTDGDAAAREVVDRLTTAFQRETERFPVSLRSADVGYLVIPTFAADERERIDQALAPPVAALRIFGWGAAAATVALALLQVLRGVGRLQPDVEVWRSLGVGRPTRSAGLALPQAVATLVGMACAMAVGWAMSALGPVGSARAIAPDGPSIPGDVALVLVGSLAVILLVAVAIVAALAAGTRSPRPPRPSALRGLLERLDPARASGVRAAARGAGAGAVLVGSTAAVIVVLASGVFSANLSALLGAPDRYGWPYDAAVLVGFGYGGADLDTIGQELADPDVEAWGAASLTSMTIDGESVPVVADRRGLGDLGTHVTAGRLPTADDEIALGHTTMRDLDADIGDHVVLDSYYGEREATVTGTIVLPGLGPYESDRTSSGTGAWLSAAFFEALVTDAERAAGLEPGSILATTASFVGVDLADGVEPAAFLGDQDLLAWDFNGFESPTYRSAARPSDLVELDAMRRVPIVLGAVFAAAMAVGLGLGIAMAARSRRSELAVLRALGCSPRQLATSVRWQALTVGAVAALAGIPLGVAAGRTLARSFLADLGVVTTVVTPWLLVVAVATGALLIAAMAGALPARSVARSRLTVPRDA